MSEIKNLAASVQARLRNYAKSENKTFNDVLTLYGLERFLYRISLSQYNDQFVLKGALVMLTWHHQPVRITRDIDLRAYIHPDIQEVAEVVKEICDVETEPEAITFDPQTIKASSIAEGADHPGVRIRFIGYMLGKLENWTLINFKSGL